MPKVPDATTRFSSTVDNYIRYRPGYPPALLQFLKQALALTPAHSIADIGSGTGKSSELFLENRNTLYGIEPNAAMREAAEHLLSAYPSFISRDGTAEATGLPAQAVDFILAGQAFHWFDIPKAREEFRRILKSPEGYVLLVWNDRRDEAGGIMQAYEDFLQAYSTDYNEINHRLIDEKVLASFFAKGFETVSFPNVQYFDRQGLKGRYASCSYALTEKHSRYGEAVEELDKIFSKFQQNGELSFLYDTKLYYGRL